MEIHPPIKRPSQVVAWLGFGISLALFILVWILNGFILYLVGQSNHDIAGLYMLMFMIGSILGILGLAFSIIGLITACRNALKKFPSVMGIVLCCASLISVFIPFFIAASIKAEKEEISLQNNTDNPNEEDGIIKNKTDIILYIHGLGDVKCSKSGDNNFDNLSAFSKYQFLREFKTWMQTNGYTKNASIVIKSDKNIDYQYIVNVIEVLNELGIKDYQVGTN